MERLAILMSKVLLLGLIFSTTSTSAQQRLLSTDKLWVYETYIHTPPKLMVLQFDTVQFQDTTFYYCITNDSFHCVPHFYREDIDTASGYSRVYFRDSLNSPNEYLMYDFTMEEGDTIEIFTQFENGNLCSDRLYVKSLYDIETFSGKERKVLELRGLKGGRFDWIEGIGNIDLFDDQIDICSVSFGSSGLLNCYFESQGIEYHTSGQMDDSDCFEPLSIKSPKTPFKITLHPNPSRDKVEVELSQASNWQLQLYHLNGQLLSEQQVHQQSQFDLDLSAFDAGVYLLQISNEKGDRVNRRVVKL